MKHFNFFVLALALMPCMLTAQFASFVGQPGCTAINKDSTIFKGWATKCHVVQGLQDISMPASGNANVGDSSSALGKAGTTGVVSLGDGGYAILQFTKPLVDETGPDLAVFENSFNDTFLELAFVEVSSDGINYFRFPAVSNTDTITQTGSFAFTDATKINNLAGKYRANYGTPFDFADIPDDALLNKQAITHVKIKDVVGCIQNQYCTRDNNHHIVNDPWPTAFGSGGFDLDAVGVIHQANATSIEKLEEMEVNVYPNPATDIVFIDANNYSNFKITLSNLMGELIFQETNLSQTVSISLADLKKGIYVLTIEESNRLKQLKIVKL